MPDRTYTSSPPPSHRPSSLADLVHRETQPPPSHHHHNHHHQQQHNHHSPSAPPPLPPSHSRKQHKPTSQKPQQHNHSHQQSQSQQTKQQQQHPPIPKQQQQQQQHPPSRSRLPPPRPVSPNSDNGSQQERNHQCPLNYDSRPHGEVSRTNRVNNADDTSPTKDAHHHQPQQTSRKRPLLSGPDISSLTRKQEDRTSNLQRRGDTDRDHNRAAITRNNRTSMQPSPSHNAGGGCGSTAARSTGRNGMTTGAGGGGVGGGAGLGSATQARRTSTKFASGVASAPIGPNETADMTMGDASAMDPLSPPKQRRRICPSGKDGRTELLEENRMLRIELENYKYRARKLESVVRKQKKELYRRDAALAKYRSQLIGLFEDEDDLVRINTKRKQSSRDGIGTSAGAPRGGGGDGDAPADGGGAGRVRGSGDDDDDDASADGGGGEDLNAVDDEGIDRRSAATGLRRSGKRGEEVDESMFLGGDVEDEWSSYSGGSGSGGGGVGGYDMSRYDDLGSRGGCEDTPYTHSEIQGKLRRTRAPAWTAAEEETFMGLYGKHGCQWKLFQEALPGRSRRQIQSHGSYLIRQGKLLKKNSRPWHRRKPRIGAPSTSMKTGEPELDGGDASD